MRMFVATLSLLLALGACVTPEERIARYEAQCRQYGFAAATEAMAQCIMRLDQTRRAEILETVRQQQLIKALTPEPEVQIIELE